MAGDLDPFAQACAQAARQLRRVPGDLRRDLGRHVRDEVARPAAAAVNTAARSAGPYGRALATAARPRAGADPAVVVGGRRPLVSGGATGRDLVYGANFGGGKRTTVVHRAGARPYRARTTMQFTRPRPWIYPALARSADDLFTAWAAALDPYLQEWENRGQ